MDKSADALEEKISTSLDQARSLGTELNAFSAIFADRARMELDAVLKHANRPMLAGKTFGLKNLYDVKGEVTLAGSIVNRDDPPAREDGPLVRKMCNAGAVLVGMHHMGEYAYDFTGENRHYGATRNPHDPERMSGGSSGGSAAAVASGIVDIALASDTNGSIRLPASLCGIYGLRPTAGRFPTSGSFPFCHTLDQLGPLAGSLEDLASAYDALSEASPETARNRLVGSAKSETLRVGRLRGWFDDLADGETRAALDGIAGALQARDIVLPGIAEARAAAFLITNAEGGALHAQRLKRRAADFDPDTRDRFIAGCLLPAAWYIRAQAYRKAFTARLERVFDDFDILIAPTSPIAAPPIGQRMMTIAGRSVPLRPNLGLFTQPVSLAGLPVLAAPIARAKGLPIGLQIVGARGRELDCFHAAAILSRLGAIGVSQPAMHVSNRLAA